MVKKGKGDKGNKRRRNNNKNFISKGKLTKIPNVFLKSKKKKKNALTSFITLNKHGLFYQSTVENPTGKHCRLVKKSGE